MYWKFKQHEITTTNTYCTELYCYARPQCNKLLHLYELKLLLCDKALVPKLLPKLTPNIDEPNIWRHPIASSWPRSFAKLLSMITCMMRKHSLCRAAVLSTNCSINWLESMVVLGVVYVIFHENKFSDEI
ncbi:hypothetical protein GQX74_006336 [Glossina fuscipes]|nr:hypothetical protein GQX74_006336 [Glossina fuscipes]